MGSKFDLNFQVLYLRAAEFFWKQASKSADKKPLYIIRPAGYKAVSKVSEHYADAMRQMAKGLGKSR